MDSTNSSKKHIFQVNGMHCKACVLVTESELKEVPYISDATSRLETRTVEVCGNFGDKTPEMIAADLSEVLGPHGYTLSVEKQEKQKNWSEFKIAIPVAGLFAVLFVLLQKMGIVNLIDASTVSYGTAFAIGIIASLSTCMAVVGGLVLSMATTFAKTGDRVKPQMMFHVGRLVSFFILGGVIGALGSVFALNTTTTFVLSVIIGLVMLILGINLLDVFHFARKLQPAMPKFLSKHALGVSKLNHWLTPLLVGVLTFFLPCGFTQSMQIFTLSTGSFLSGGMYMLAFALGTLPVLALISFSSLSIKNSRYAGVFFKTAGLVVILFAVFNLLNSLVVIGLIPPLFNF
ncbi:MAG: sulfite exporter TauE/SafE family protein [Candidatus Magasanikbacteria bacterium]|nr:sulfite exporter TauE/SafE family protein [Candidatus Magasanikbacteria bacterium]